MVELLKFAWNIDTVTVLRKLHHHGFGIPVEAILPALASKYDLDVFGHQVRFSKFLAASQQNAFQDTQIWQKLHDQLDLGQHLIGDRWYDQLGKSIIPTTMMDTIACFKPVGLSRTDKGFLRAGDKMLVRGAAWRQLLLIPLQDAPGRYSGGILVGGRLRNPQDMVCRRIAQDHTTRIDVSECGIGFMEHLTVGDHPVFQEQVLVTADVEMAIRLHTRWARDNSSKFPLILSRYRSDGQSRRSWTTLPAKKCVCWDKELTVENLAMACWSDGYVSHVPWQPKQDLNWIADWMHRAMAAAVPWRVALCEFLLHSSVKMQETFLYALQLSLDERLDLINRVDDRTAYLITCLFPNVPARPEWKAVRLDTRPTRMNKRIKSHRKYFAQYEPNGYKSLSQPCSEADGSGI